MRFRPLYRIFGLATRNYNPYHSLNRKTRPVMKSVLLLGIAGLAVNAQAQAQAPINNNDNMSLMENTGRVDTSKYPLPQIPSVYVSSDEAASSPQVIAISNAAASNSTTTPEATATELVKALFKKAEFRLVDDHYTGTNGISHFHFRQMMADADIINADFNINIGRDGSIFSYSQNFYTGRMGTPMLPIAPAIEALKSANDALGLNLDISSAEEESDESPVDTLTLYTFSGIKGAKGKPTARVVYFHFEEHLKTIYVVETNVGGGLLSTYVDAFDTSVIYGVIDQVQN